MVIWISMPLFAAVAPMLERAPARSRRVRARDLASADAALTQSLSPTIYDTRPAMIFAWQSIDAQHSSNLDLTVARSRALDGDAVRR